MIRLLEEKKKILDSFLVEVDLANHYRYYRWEQDRWSDGFHDIFLLEKSIIKAVKSNQLSKIHIVNVARWGGLPNTARIKCLKDPIVLPLYEGDQKSPILTNDPLLPVRMIEQQTEGIGPTYISKLLRFALPSVFGAIDSRLVRVFGLGDRRSSHLLLLNLIAKQGQDGRWAITHENWPVEYGTWLSILNYVAGQLNASDNSCPHPKNFVNEGLRESGKWIVADVEMALFSYSSRKIPRKKSI